MELCLLFRVILLNGAKIFLKATGKTIYFICLILHCWYVEVVIIINFCVWKLRRKWQWQFQGHVDMQILGKFPILFIWTEIYKSCHIAFVWTLTYISDNFFPSLSYFNILFCRSHSLTRLAWCMKCQKYLMCCIEVWSVYRCSLEPFNVGEISLLVSLSAQLASLVSQPH